MNATVMLNDAEKENLMKAKAEQSDDSSLFSVSSIASRGPTPINHVERGITPSPFLTETSSAKKDLDASSFFTLSSDADNKSQID